VRRVSRHLLERPQCRRRTARDLGVPTLLTSHSRLLGERAGNGRARALTLICESGYFVLQSIQWVAMRDLDKALADITAIRSQMARGAEFRGYGPMTVAATGFLALLAAAVQALWLPDPATDIFGYLLLWLATAAISVILIGIEMVARTRRIHSGLADEMIHAATEQFIPAGVAGALLTFVLFRFVPQSLWMLPGLWQIVFSLGFLASCRSLPRPMFGVGVWYLAAGLTSLALASEAHAFFPLAMAIPFGFGQLAMAAILYWSAGENGGGEYDAES
jgi:hypothetical protein